jgi:hypothetical protein
MDLNKRPAVDRRTVVRTMAWSAPVVAVASTAPAFAGTPPPAPDLSTSTAGTPTRVPLDSTVSIPPNTTTFTNTGLAAAEGLIATISTTDPGSRAAGRGNITDVRIGGQPYADFAGLVDVTGVGTESVTLTISAAVVNIAPGASFDLPLGLDFDLDSTKALNFSVNVAAGNGGVPTAFASVPLADQNAPALATSTPAPPTRKSATVVTVPPATFKNNGNAAAAGIRVRIVSDKAILSMKAFGQNIANLGIVFEPGYEPGPGRTEIRMSTPPTGLAAMGVPANGSKTAAAGQDFEFDSAGPVVFSTTVYPYTTDRNVPTGVPAKFLNTTVA